MTKNSKKDKNLTVHEYSKLLEKIKKDIQQTQLKAVLAVTKELIMLYWRIGNLLSKKITSEKWGAKIIDQLARDIQSSFLDVSGFSVRNLKYMRKLADSYQETICAAAAAQIPWGHNMVILDRVKDSKQRIWYIEQTIENGWSRASLTMWIESNLYSRRGKAVSNFKATLPEPQSDLAEQALKDPYNFNFLIIDRKARELEIELGLMSHIQKFLLELGQGFAFLGRQFLIKVGTKEFFIDMLFYHLDLRCYIVIELKAEEFDARNLGQINLYLSAVDSILKRPEDTPTIGLLLCRSKDNIVAEYALRGITKPIGISSYTTKLVESLPKEFKGKLPTIKEIESELEKTKIPTIEEIKRLKKPVKRLVKKEASTKSKRKK